MQAEKSGPTVMHRQACSGRQPIPHRRSGYIQSLRLFEGNGEPACLRHGRTGHARSDRQQLLGWRVHGPGVASSAQATRDYVSVRQINSGRSKMPLTDGLSYRRSEAAGSAEKHPLGTCRTCAPVTDNPNISPGCWSAAADACDDDDGEGGAACCA